MASIELASVSSVASGAVGAMNVTLLLAGNVAEGGSSTGIIRAISRPVGFYESVAAQITNHFQTLADANSLIARYDNDLRGSPTDDLWCDVLVNFGASGQHELGNRNNFRVVGNLNIRIINDIGEGLATQLEAADLIADEFRTKNVGRISFGVPTIQKVGRVGDNEYINVTCPFFVDKSAS